MFALYHELEDDVPDSGDFRYFARRQQKKTMENGNWRLRLRMKISCYAINVQVAGTLALVMITDLTVNIIALKVCSDHSDCLRLLPTL